MGVIILSVLTITCVYLLCTWMRKKFMHFQKAGVKYSEPVLIFGNLLKAIFRIKHVGELLKEIGLKYPGERYFGFFTLTRPTIVIQDPKLVETICVKSFQDFCDRVSLHKDCDLQSVLPFTQVAEWRAVKPIMINVLGDAKLNGMYPIISNCSENMVNHCKKLIHKNENQGNQLMELYCSELTENFILELSLSLMFGTTASYFQEEDKKFAETVMQMSKYDNQTYLRVILWELFPTIMKRLDIGVLNKEAFKHLQERFAQSLSERKKSSVYRDDMCQSFLDIIKNITEAADAKKQFKPSIANDELLRLLLAQPVSLVAAGVDAMASSLHFLLNELTKNPDVQKKLMNEIDHVQSQHGKEISFNTVSNMPYLDMVVSESLRKWPQTLPMILRVCSRDHELPPPREGGKPYLIRRGEVVWISVLSIHFDETFWPDPETFDPERFNVENRKNIVPYSYLPFGVGPRSCLGNRLVLAAMKSSIFHLLSSFQFVKSSNFNETLRYRQDGLTLRPEDFTIALKLRNL